MKEYDPKEIEQKWQKDWEKSGIYHAEDKSKKPKYYTLVEFPYPSGDGLHVGHVRSYTAMDALSRKRRMQGYDVLYPIGWDAFGLPTENYAIKTGKDPRVVTEENSANFRRQLKSLGLSFDWSREINTTDPTYYKWTQWIFLKFLEKGLAYKAKTEINWCPKDKIGLANEEVVDGKCERCGTEVEKREKEQWMLAITKYADRLEKDLDDVDYPDRVKTQQRNWIGKSEGALIKFDTYEVFTTRPDTIFGATFLVKAGKEDRFTGEYVTNPATGEKIPVWEAEYVYADYGTGAIMGVPAHDERDYEFATKHNIPINYVVAPFFLDDRDQPKEGMPFVERKAVNCYLYDPRKNQYLFISWKDVWWNGPVTGGIEENESLEEAGRREIYEESGYKNVKFICELGSPVRVDFFHHIKKENRKATFHGLLFELENDEQDAIDPKEAALHDLRWVEAKDVPEFMATGQTFFQRILNQDFVYEGEGRLVNSHEFNDLPTEEAGEKITDKFGKKVTKYKLRDWIFSRQRYWGEPIPVVHCDKCGVVPVPEKDLPLLLPEVENYIPTETGESPLANIDEWVNTKCPKCEDDAKRETDVMPNWAGSSWYFLRYADALNDKEFASKENLKHWMPVDWYNGGMEHTTLHLLYSRFWNKFLFDIGLVPTSEPYKKRTSHGLILAEGGVKMSKSLGNVVNPDSIVERFGADTLRVYEMFMGPFEQAISWNEDSLAGPRRFLEKVWRITEKIGGEGELTALAHETIKKVSEDVEELGFNTAVSALMIFTNDLDRRKEVSKVEYETLLLLLAPFAPHIVEELWHKLGHKESVHLAKWPEYDESKLVSDEAHIIVQVNGRKRGELSSSIDISEADAVEKAESLPEVKKWIEGKVVKKRVYVPGKIVNFVINS